MQCDGWEGYVKRMSEMAITVRVFDYKLEGRRGDLNCDGRMVSEFKKA
jgi:hypothetical protein